MTEEQNNYLIPTVIEKSGYGERAYDIYSRLLKDRIIFLGSGIDDGVANTIIAQLLFLTAQDASADEHAEGDTQHDEGGRDRDGREQPGQGRADQQSGCAGQAAADPQLVRRQAAHHHGMPVEPVRKEHHGAVRTDVLMLGHGRGLRESRSLR